MIHAGRKRRVNGPVSWVGDRLLVTFFCSSFCFLFCSSSPTRASIFWVGVNGFALCPDPFFLRSFLLVSFLGIDACQPRFSGIRYMSNNGQVLDIDEVK